jgi:hypothetical protein
MLPVILPWIAAGWHNTGRKLDTMTDLQDFYMYDFL